MFVQKGREVMKPIYKAIDGHHVYQAGEVYGKDIWFPIIAVHVDVRGDDSIGRLGFSSATAA